MYNHVGNQSAAPASTPSTYNQLQRPGGATLHTSGAGAGTQSSASWDAYAVCSNQLYSGDQTLVVKQGAGAGASAGVAVPAVYSSYASAGAGAGRNASADSTDNRRSTSVLAKDADGCVADERINQANAASEYAVPFEDDMTMAADVYTLTAKSKRRGQPQQKGSVYLGFDEDNEESML